MSIVLTVVFVVAAVALVGAALGVEAAVAIVQPVIVVLGLAALTLTGLNLIAEGRWGEGLPLVLIGAIALFAMLK